MISVVLLGVLAFSLAPAEALKTASERCENYHKDELPKHGLISSSCEIYRANYEVIAPLKQGKKTPPGQATFQVGLEVELLPYIRTNIVVRRLRDFFISWFEKSLMFHKIVLNYDVNEHKKRDQLLIRVSFETRSGNIFEVHIPVFETNSDDFKLEKHDMLRKFLENTDAQSIVHQVGWLQDVFQNHEGTPKKLLRQTRKTLWDQVTHFYTTECQYVPTGTILILAKKFGWISE